VGATLLPAALAACDGGPVAVEEPESESAFLCPLPQELLSGSAGPLDDRSALRGSFAHAATVMTPSLPEGPARDRLREDLGLLGQTFGAQLEADCAHVASAWSSLAAIPRTSESLPDRDGIEMMLALAARALAALAAAD
jgi:hypothetical protein